MEAKGIGCMFIVQVVFVVLKLIDVIHWSWLWVLSPLWLTGIATLAIALITIIVAAVAVVIAKHDDD